jgi:2-dehydropantoate 2-reductase
MQPSLIARSAQALPYENLCSRRRRHWWFFSGKARRERARCERNRPGREFGGSGRERDDAHFRTWRTAYAKYHQVASVAESLRALIGPETLIVTTQNGIPWWYFNKHGGAYEGQRVEAVDPGGVISSNLPVDRTIGCIVYPACEMNSPGVIQQIEGNRFPLGEIDGADTPRIRALADVFRAAGFKTPILSDIRSEIWLKLWGNLSFNPISALTHATLEDICTYEPTRALAKTMMLEAQAIGEKLGVKFKVAIDKRINGAQAVGQHKTSMLQDVELGRQLELDALVKSVIELGRITQTPTPTIEHVYALAALLQRTLSQHKAKLALTSI